MDATAKTAASIFRRALVVVLGGTTVGGLVWWLMQPYEPKPTTIIAIICDRSNSMLGDPKCRSIEGIVSQILATPHLVPGSHIVVYGTGSKETAMEPVLIGSYEIPVSNRVMEGKEAAVAARRALLTSIVADCQEASTIVTTDSPILLSVKRVLEQLSATGCGAKSACRLYARSDGEEMSEVWLSHEIGNSTIKASAPPTVLDNSRIAVTFCGLSETVGEPRKDKRGRRVATRRDSANVEILQAAWRKVFTQPDRVVFEPFCPRTVEERR